MNNVTKYAFFDAWLLSRLTDEGFASGLSRFLRERDLVPVCTGLTFVELYNPGWEKAVRSERGKAATSFIAEHPCVFVDPTDIYAAEYKAFPGVPSEMPIRLDLALFNAEVRGQVLLEFLRGGNLFTRHDVDVVNYADTYDRIKQDWQTKARQVVDTVLAEAGGTRVLGGGVKIDRASREVALLSLDLRMVESSNPDDYLARAASARSIPVPVMRSVRTTSLAMWHLFAAPDAADRLALRPSDIGDIHHLALAPYCEVFTADSTMYRLLLRVAPELGLDVTKLFSPARLESLLASAQTNGGQ